MDIYDQIIEELRGLVGKGKRFESDAALANFCEVDSAFVHKHLRGKIKGDKIRPLLDFLNKAGVNMSFVGENFPIMRRIGANAPNQIVQGDNVQMIDVMAVVGAGPGQYNYGLEPIASIPILQEFIHPDLFICKVQGDSMTPIIPDGAYVGAVPLSGPPRDGKIYLIYDELLGAVAKHVYYGGPGRLILKSENPNAPDIFLEMAGHEQVFLGEVLWTWHDFGMRRA